ncbi:MAG: endolytic transglycosylase MltG [Chthonomonadales bacterium]|nr:endolytic transglycosylase MltG [Chthonomonadales bacterium]
MPRGPQRNRLPWVLSAALAAAACALAWGAHELAPVSARGRTVRVAVARGQNVWGVAAMLARRGLIRRSAAFVVYAVARGDAGRIRAGEYGLSPSMSAAQILDRLKRGGADADDRVVVVPEGFTVAQIAHALSQRGVASDEAAVRRLARRPGGAVRAPFPMAHGLEGYLFPDTYRLAPRAGAAAALQAMVDTFAARFYEPHAAEIARSGHSLHEVVTIASLVEREARVDADRPQIAGVIENRLARGMRLEIDASVLYALGQHKSRVLFSDLEVASPYNTYRRAGLPPGPIASPGLASLVAALRPARSDRLFYVANPDGTHTFTRTLAEHRAATARARRSAGGPP